jgi:hypothetical protein
MTPNVPEICSECFFILASWLHAVPQAATCLTRPCSASCGVLLSLLWWRSSTPPRLRHSLMQRWEGCR